MTTCLFPLFLCTLSKCLCWLRTMRPHIQRLRATQRSPRRRGRLEASNRGHSHTQARGSQMPYADPPLLFRLYINLVFDMIVLLSSCALCAGAGVVRLTRGGSWPRVVATQTLESLQGTLCISRYSSTRTSVCVEVCFWYLVFSHLETTALGFWHLVVLLACQLCVRRKACYYLLLLYLV